MLATTSPFPFYTELDGDPLEGGKIYYGVVNQNPETSPIQVYWDAAGTQPAAQPIRTSNGFTLRSGTPALVYAGSDYSLTVRDSRGRMVYYAANSADFSNSSAVQAALNAYIALLASTNVAGGASLIDFDRTAAYPASTLGRHALTTCSPRDFPWLAVGDGVVDDTAALLACFAYAGPRNMIVNGEGLNYKTTGPLAYAGGLGGGPIGFRLAPTGSGYRVLTVTGLVTYFDVYILGTGNVLDGVLFGGSSAVQAQRSTIQRVEVDNLAGNGVSLNTTWDSVFQTISVQDCGSATKYAFEVLSTGDTSNMTHILHLQVERANQKAIFVDPGTLCCVIDNIHSEGATGATGVVTWRLGGNRCTYNNARLASLNPTLASVFLSAADTTFTNLLVEGAIPITADAYGASGMTLITPEVQGTFGAVSGQTGLITIEGGKIASFVSDAGAFRVFGTKVTTSLNVGFAQSTDPTLMKFFGCQIASVTSSSSQAAATFIDCEIAEHNGVLLQGTTVLENTIVSGATPLTVNFRTLIMKGSRLNSDIILNTGVILATDTVFNGAMGISGGGNTSILGSGCSCTGSLSGFNAIPASSVGNPGSRHYNISPVVGAPKSWAMTASHTWISEGNL